MPVNYGRLPKFFVWRIQVLPPKNNIVTGVANLGP